MKHYTKEQVKELETAVREGDSDNKYFKRLQAVSWRAGGRTIKEIAELSGYNRSSVLRLCANYMQGGLKALRAQYVCNNRKLSYADEAATLEKLSESATVGKYVRASELLQQFEAITGVSYQIDAFYRLLWRHGWRKVMPRGQHPKKASDEAIEASKKLTLR